MSSSMCVIPWKKLKNICVLGIVFTVSILAVTKEIIATTLSDAAAALGAGQWTTISTVNINPALTQTGGSSGFIFGYTEEMKWDTVTKRSFYVGMDHNQVPSVQRFVSYDDTSNTWSVLPTQPWMSTGPSGTPMHGYDHMAVDPAHRFFYTRGSFTGRTIHKYNMDTGAWLSDLPDNNVLDYVQCCAGIEYFPDMGGLIWVQGSEGSTPTTGAVYFFSDATQTWSRIGVGDAQNGFYTMGKYSNFAEYSPVYKVVVFGGGVGPDRHMWKLNASGVVTALGNAPVDLGVQNALFTVEPVSGLFLVASNTNTSFYSYNPQTDVWTLLSNNPPIFQSPVNQTPVHGLAAMPINNYGVVMYVDCGEAQGTCVARLYRHTTGTPDLTPPTVTLTAPAPGANVSGTVTVSANANDNVSVAGVQFKLDSANLGAEDTVAPYSVSWDTTTGTSGSHTLTAVARDGSGNTATSGGVTVTVANPADSAPPTVPTGLTATVASASQINLSWSPSTDNVGVTGYKVFRGGTQISSGVATSYNDTGLTASTTYIYTVSAFDAAGNNSAQSGSVNATTQAGGTQSDFATRCAAPGVVRCYGFDDATDLLNYYNYPFSAPTEQRGFVDTSVKVSGAGSLRFTVPSNSGSDTSGSFSMNFTPGSLNCDKQGGTGNCPGTYGTQFGPGQDFFVQWRQRFSPEFLQTVYLGTTGFKQSDIAEGDRFHFNTDSCRQMEVNTVNNNQHGFVSIYHSCGLKDNQYQGLEQPIPPSDFKLQNAMPSPFCLYTKAKNGDITGCLPYAPNEWMTFQMGMHVGTWYLNDHVYHRDSRVRLWVGREGQPSVLVHDTGLYTSGSSPDPGTFTQNTNGGYDLANTNAAAGAKYGKIWLLPYMTNKDPTQTHPVAYTWYDDLIISTQKIADPSTGVSLPPAAPTGIKVDVP